MTLFYLLFIFYTWIKTFLFQPEKQSSNKLYYRPKKIPESPKRYSIRRKPQWVIDKVIYLKAVNPQKGCRKIAALFNRLYQKKRNMTVSKSYVYMQLKQYQYEVTVLRRKIKHNKPKRIGQNIC